MTNPFFVFAMTWNTQHTWNLNVEKPLPKACLPKVSIHTVSSRIIQSPRIFTKSCIFATVWSLKDSATFPFQKKVKEPARSPRGKLVCWPVKLSCTIEGRVLKQSSEVCKNISKPFKNSHLNATPFQFTYAFT